MVRYINIKKVSFIISKEITKYFGKAITEHIQFFLPVVWLLVVPSKKAITEHIQSSLPVVWLFAIPNKKAITENIQFFLPYISVIVFSLSIRFINVCNK